MVIDPACDTQQGRTKAVNFHLTRNRGHPLNFSGNHNANQRWYWKFYKQKKKTKDNESSCVRLNTYRILSIILFLWSAAGCLNTSAEWAEAYTGCGCGPYNRTPSESLAARVRSELPVQREARDAFSGLAWGSQRTICFSTFQSETKTSVTVYYPTSGKRGGPHNVAQQKSIQPHRSGIPCQAEQTELHPRAVWHLDWSNGECRLQGPSCSMHYLQNNNKTLRNLFFFLLTSEIGVRPGSGFLCKICFLVWVKCEERPRCFSREGTIAASSSLTPLPTPDI